MTFRQKDSAQGVVYRRTPEGLELALLLRTGPAGGPVWVLPHAEVADGERGEDAARRAVREDLGVPARIQERLGQVRTWVARGAEGQRAMVEMAIEQFLLEADGEEGGGNHDSLAGGPPARWLTLDEALRLASFETDRAVVRKAVERLRGRAG